MVFARVALATLVMTVLVTVSHAITVGPGDIVRADFSLASPPTGYSEMFSEVGFNQAGTEDFQYSIYDGNNTEVFSQHVSTLNVSYTQFWIANPITTSNFHITIHDIASTFNIDVINVIFFNYLTDIHYPDFPNASSLQSVAPNLTFNSNHFAIRQTPLPAALPLFATGPAWMGLLGWRRKRGRAGIAEG